MAQHSAVGAFDGINLSLPLPMRNLDRQHNGYPADLLSIRRTNNVAMVKLYEVDIFAVCYRGLTQKISRLVNPVLLHLLHFRLQ